MTVDELNDALDAMAAKAGDDPQQMPGLITFHTDAWLAVPEVRAKVKNLADQMRHRDVVIHVGGQQTTAVLTRAEAGERGEPYRDLQARS